MKITYNGVELDVEKAEIIASGPDAPGIAKQLAQDADGMHASFFAVDYAEPGKPSRVRLTLRKKEQ